MNVGKTVIMMGVSGTGKTTVGMGLAQALNAKFIDGDDLHPRDNILKMKTGQGLNDSDRAPWLERLSDVIFSLGQKSETGVLVCSALKKSYRDRLRAGNSNLVFIWLKGDFDCVRDRMQKRKGHFMPEALLRSQFNTLETPDSSENDIMAVEIHASVENIISECLLRVKTHALNYINDEDFDGSLRITSARS